MAAEKKDALDYFMQVMGFNVNTTRIPGPLSFMFDPALDENWRLLYQALGLVIVLLLVLGLDKLGFFVHLRSQRVQFKPLLLAITLPENLPEIVRVAARRGVRDDEPKDEEIDCILPRRADSFEFTHGDKLMTGVVLEAGLPRATERGCLEWGERWKKVPCSVMLLQAGDSVVITMSERRDINGPLLRRRFPRFVRKAFKRRTSGQEEMNSYLLFSSPPRNCMFALAPISNKSWENILDKCSSLESKKDA